MAGRYRQKLRPVSDLERIRVFQPAEFAVSLLLNRVLFTTDATARHPLQAVSGHFAAGLGAEFWAALAAA